MTDHGDRAGGPGSPWHAGERAMQERAGKRERMEQLGRVVLRDHMPDQHRQFFAERNQLFLATLDATGQPWATMVEGPVGFITAPTSGELRVMADLPAADPAFEGFREGGPVGALGLEYATRRRNRVNGRLRLGRNEPGFAIAVEQSFGNCPQYIQARALIGAAEARLPGPEDAVRRSEGLDDEAVGILTAADTFFIASRSGAPYGGGGEGLDMSHRGGRPGFIAVHGLRELAFPDFRGNFFFNTLGNLLVDPRAGLLVVDFATGTSVQIAGRARIAAATEVGAQGPEVERAVVVSIDRVVMTPARSRWRWQWQGYAPQLE